MECWKTDSSKRYSIKIEVPLKKTEMIEDEKGKEIRSHVDKISSRTDTDRLSNGEEGIDSNKY